MPTARIYVLGAGFSATAGVPIARELWLRVSDRISANSGNARRFVADIERYRKYRLVVDGIAVARDQINFEEFLEFLDIEHYFGLRGRDTWSDDGNKTTVLIKTMIGRVLTEHMPSPREIPDLYLRFAEGLNSSDLIITFNYDVLLERSLDRIGKRYRLYPYRYKSISEGGVGNIDSRYKDEIVILKMHGSLDWFSREHYDWLLASHQRFGLKRGPANPLFNDPGAFGVKPIVAGPRPPGDQLRHLHRVTEIEKLYAQDIEFLVTPWLLAPSAAKTLYMPPLREFWFGAGEAGVLNLAFNIIGCSLPNQDKYARQAISEMVQNYQQYEWDSDFFGRKKTPLLVVNRCKSKSDESILRASYRFVDWTRAKLYKSGFDSRSAKMSQEVKPHKSRRTGVSS